MLAVRPACRHRLEPEQKSLPSDPPIRVGPDGSTGAYRGGAKRDATERVADLREEAKAVCPGGGRRVTRGRW
jgi:hypothetical protein